MKIPLREVYLEFIYTHVFTFLAIFLVTFGFHITIWMKMISLASIPFWLMEIDFRGKFCPRCKNSLLRHETVTSVERPLHETVVLTLILAVKVVVMVRMFSTLLFSEIAKDDKILKCVIYVFRWQVLYLKIFHM